MKIEGCFVHIKASMNKNKIIQNLSGRKGTLNSLKLWVLLYWAKLAAAKHQ